MKRVGQLYREKIIERIKSGVSENESVFVLNYSALSCFKIDTLRKDLRKAGASVYVSKNRLVQHALKSIEKEELASDLDGQTALVWSNGDSAAVSKILIDFSKDLENVNVQKGLLDGRVIDKSDIKKLSELPSREVLLSQLLGIIQAPVSRVMGALNAKSRDLLSILKQLSEKKGDS